MSILSTGEWYEPAVACWIPTALLVCDLCGRRVECTDNEEVGLLLSGKWLAVRLRNQDGELVEEHHCECRRRTPVLRSRGL